MDGAILIAVSVLRPEAEFLVKLIIPRTREEVFVFCNFRLTLEEIQNFA